MYYAQFVISLFLVSYSLPTSFGDFDGIFRINIKCESFGNFGANCFAFFNNTYTENRLYFKV